MNKKSASGILLGLGMISILLISNGIASYAQTNVLNMTTNSTMSNATAASNSSGITNTTSLTSDNPVLKSIDDAISAIKSSDNKAGKKLLYEAESALEGKSDVVDAEKRIEASLQALKDGDTNAAISHAEEAKKSLS
ncbi:MAG TPA: hypothetical protein VH415_11030 [Nitrososphaeraceae archaeon]